MAKVLLVPQDPAVQSLFYRGHISGKVYVRGHGGKMVCLEDGKTLDYQDHAFIPLQAATKLEITV